MRLPQRFFNLSIGARRKGRRNVATKCEKTFVSNQLPKMCNRIKIGHAREVEKNIDD